ncbi:MAG TPA: Holliday junction branch migration protein RuvA [Tepidisphaeraceae bacterium]|jgi:Holliday junction DNA helicase RuvA
MIASLSGELFSVEEDRILLKAGAMVYELLVPAADVQELSGRVGEEITLHTLFYIEGDSSGGNMAPRLIGFVRKEDKKFFLLFTTVKGIGPKTALKAFTVPTGLIAAAIEGKDSRTLTQLKGVGKRTAELIIAELSGKVGAFVGIETPKPRTTMQHSSEDEEAIGVMVSPQMGLRRAEAEMLLNRVKRETPKLVKAEELVPEMLKLYAQRR